MTRQALWKTLPRPILAAGVILTGALALPAAVLAGPAAPNQAPPRDIEQTVPPEPSKKSFDPLQSGPSISPKQAAARLHKCARATYVVKQANGFQDDSPLTVRYYQQALDLCPGHPEANFRLGVIAYNKKDIDGAIKLFERAVKSDLKFVDGYYNLAIIYRKQKKTKKAREYFQTTLKHNPRDPLALYNMGVLQYLSLDRDEALKSFQKSAAANPRMAEPHFFIGALHQEQGRHGAAKKELRNAIRLNPKLTLPRVYLSAILEIEGDNKGARAELNRALELNPASVNVGYGVEEFYFQESQGNEILSHIRVRRVDALPKPPMKANEAKSAFKMNPPPPGKTKSPGKNAGNKKNLGPRREAREISPRPIPQKKRRALKKSASKKRTPPKKKNLYRVRRGDTLAKIANRYGTTLKTLMGLNYNRIEHPSVIEIGDVIRVPRKSRASVRKDRKTGPRRSYRVYRIKRGDTLAKVARRFRTSTKTLLRLNRKRIEHPDYIEVGTRIRVPAPPRKSESDTKKGK